MANKQEERRILANSQAQEIHPEGESPVSGGQ